MEVANSKKIAQNTLYLYFRMFLVMLVTLYTSRVVLKTLGFEDFGLYNVVGSVVVFLSFFQSALSNATYRYIAYELGKGDRGKLNIVYSMAVNCHFILAALFVAILEIGGVWFINHKLNVDPSRMVAANWLFQLSLLSFFLGVVRTPYNSNIIANERMNFYAIISIAEAILKLIVVLLLVYSPFDKLIFYGFLLFVVSLVIFVCYYLYCKIYIGDIEYVFCWDGSLLKKFATYSGWSLFVNAADMSTQQCISIFFNWFVGVVGNAALGITNQVIGGVNGLVANFSVAFNPQLIKSYASNNLSYFMNLIFSASKVAYILYIVVAIPVLNFWLGDYPSMAADFIGVAVIYYMLDSLQSPLFQAVHATGNIRTHHLIVGTIKFMAIPGIYLLLRMGCSAVVALALWSFSNLVVSIARTIYMRKLISLNIGNYLLQVVCPLVVVTVVACGVAGVFTYVMVESWFRFFAIFLVSVFIILFLSYIIVFNQQEKLLLRQVPVISNLLNLRSNKKA